MITLVVDGCPPWDGRYEAPVFELTQRELHRIKQLSGVRAGELVDALDARDAAAVVGVAVVVLARAGKQVDPDDLWDAPVGSLLLDITDDTDDTGAVGADDADPPSSPAGSGGNESGDAGTGDGSASGGE